MRRRNTWIEKKKQREEEEEKKLQIASETKIAGGALNRLEKCVCSTLKWTEMASLICQLNWTFSRIKKTKEINLKWKRVSEPSLYGWKLLNILFEMKIKRFYAQENRMKYSIFFFLIRSLYISWENLRPLTDIFHILHSMYSICNHDNRIEND